MLFKRFLKIRFSLKKEDPTVFHIHDVKQGAQDTAQPAVTRTYQFLMRQSIAQLKSFVPNLPVVSKQSVHCIHSL
jgi:hypothetical protein